MSPAMANRRTAFCVVCGARRPEPELDARKGQCKACCPNVKVHLPPPPALEPAAPRKPKRAKPALSREQRKMLKEARKSFFKRHPHLTPGSLGPTRTWYASKSIHGMQ